MLRPTCQAICNNKKPCTNFAKKVGAFCGVHKHKQAAAEEVADFLARLAEDQRQAAEEGEGDSDSDAATGNQYDEKIAKLEHERDVLWAICLGNYNREDEFRELVRQKFDSDMIGDMVRGGKDCGVIEDYFYDQPEADCEECEEDED
jgi:hypothetical protein